MTKYIPCFEKAYLGENVKKIVAQAVAISLGYFFFSWNPNKHSKSSLIGEKLPNLVTLLTNSQKVCPGQINLWNCIHNTSFSS